jgi:hypothetical protein
MIAVHWLWRSHEPATQPPHPNYPVGVAIDVTKPGDLRACSVKLDYPAPGVGTWVLVCDACGMTLGVTAAGRADDPTMVKVACKEGQPK